jgi:hypothetical protein
MIPLRELSDQSLRIELRLYLTELATDDPIPIWAREREEGLASGIDEVFHFLFDDHEFDGREVGRSLRNEHEVQAVGALKQALSKICDVLPGGRDAEFVRHPAWAEVRHLAAEAGERLDAD